MSLRIERSTSCVEESSGTIDMLPIKTKVISRSWLPELIFVAIYPQRTTFVYPQYRQHFNLKLFGFISLFRGSKLSIQGLEFVLGMFVSPEKGLKSCILLFLYWLILSWLGGCSQTPKAEGCFCSCCFSCCSCSSLYFFRSCSASISKLSYTIHHLQFR